MENDEVERLIEKAHEIFNKTSIYEVMDLEPVTAIMTLVDYYGPTHKDNLNKYLSILDQLRVDEGAVKKKELTCEEYFCLMGGPNNSYNQISRMFDVSNGEIRPRACN